MATGGAPPDAVAAPYTTAVGWLFAEVSDTGAGHTTAGPVGN